jgi:molybdate transport system permease protein
VVAAGGRGAVISFASDMPGQTRTLPPFFHAALEAPGRKTAAAKPFLAPFTPAVAGLVAQWGQRLLSR